MSDPDRDPEPDIPAAWRADAEEVRAHLCALRGGGAFLSPADALQLVSWFEQGVGVPAILTALERAADARRKARNRVPLSLVAAKRHLGRETRGAFHRDPPVPGREPPLAPAARAMLSAPGPDAARRRLEAELLGVSAADPEGAVRAALAAVRVFLDAAWAALGDAGQAALQAQAEAELGDLLGLVDPHRRLPLVEETARDLLRQRYPALTAATFAALLAAHAATQTEPPVTVLR